MALKGLVSLYCKGERQDICVRKRVSKKLGDPKMVPKNMMPHGYVISGTNNLNWSREVKDIVRIAIREL